MNSLKIFVEGDADKKFLQDVIKFCTGIVLKDDIIGVGGWNNILSEGSKGEFIRIEMKKNSDNFGDNLIIFDADVDFNDRELSITQWSIDYNLDFDLFLFPNNHDNGDLETLLERIINPIHNDIFICWNQFETCLKGKNPVGMPHGYTVPAKKSKIYSYMEALHGTSKKEKEKCKDPNRNFLNENHWNLNSPYLLSLITFLRKSIMK